MIVAVVETPNFVFTAAGDFEEDCEKALSAAWQRHVRQYVGADPGLMDEMIDQHEITFNRLEPGVVLRDGERV